MKPKLLSILQCPRCNAPLTLTSLIEDQREVRTGSVTCSKDKDHVYEIKEGIVHMATGFDHEAVKKELEYENTTYKGSDRLTDAKIIAQFPETLAELWPHIVNFGPDFKMLIEHLNIKPGDWVLDVGTGPCWSSRLLAQKDANVIAMDVNEANYYGLKTSDILFDAHNVYFERILESMTNLPFKDGTIDYITFNASFHHTPDMAKTLTECKRVLKPGGVIAMVNEEFASLRQKLFNTETVSDTGSHHTIPYTEFEDAVEAGGFELEFYVAQHVQEKLNQKLPAGLGNWVVKTLEAFPMALKQLNSALILLRKPGQLKSNGKTEQDYEMKR